MQYKSETKSKNTFFLLHSKMILVALVSRYFLANKNTNEASYFGRRFKPYVPQGYMSGGAGYVLSKMALKKFVEKGVDDRSKVLPGGCRGSRGLGVREMYAEGRGHCR